VKKIKIKQSRRRCCGGGCPEVVDAQGHGGGKLKSNNPVDAPRGTGWKNNPEGVGSKLGMASGQ